MDILEDLDKSGKLYTVPHRCLDDYYWMLSSVSNQKQSKGSTNLDVDTDNEEGRWPGTRPMLLTNDQMRDHKLELLEPRLFRRWVSSHIVNYHFPPFLNNAAEEREITFTPADCISREIQGNLSNNNGLNDQNAMAWHFPVKDWDNADRFCVRIPKLQQDIFKKETYLLTLSEDYNMIMDKILEPTFVHQYVVGCIIQYV